MCGICGIYHTDGQRPIDRAGLKAMMNSMHHRGPDVEGRFIGPSVGLGHRRLGIIDLHGGHQPIFNEDESVVVVANGEIYNYHELTERLRALGHTFRTGSDSEVLVHLYEEYGEDCVHHLRGMYGFAIWDGRTSRLFVTRDRVGIKPIYFSWNHGQLIFASEIKAILHYPGVRRELDPEALALYTGLKYVPAPRTMFAGIQALMPGHSLICDENGLRVQQYWDLSFQQDEPAKSEAMYQDELDRLLNDSVRSHLVSDVPVGAFLSGGVDSSLIVALMSQHVSKPVPTFSVGFEGPGEAYSELPYARKVARQYQTEHHEVMISADNFVDVAERVTWHIDQPIADEATLANYLVSELASKHVKVVLTGEGGDELFAGYARYAGEQFSPIVSRLPNVAKRGMLALTNRVNGLRRPKIALYALTQADEAVRHANWFPLFNQEMRSTLLTEKLRSDAGEATPEQFFAETLARTDAVDPLSRMLYVDTKSWLVDDLLARGDKTSMAWSLEARVPLLDHHVVEFAARLPSNLKLNRMTRKYLLKQVGRSYLPDEIIDRKKKGFPIPIALWFRDEARSFVRDTLAPDTLRRRGLYCPHYVTELIDNHENGTVNASSLLWGLINVELWHRAFIDQLPAQQAPAASELDIIAAD